LETLPNYHRDPFDRMLIAQAQTEGLVLLTADHNFEKYPVETFWCGT
jgi:PIN domain nuclease of toxin-antitoxin system